MLPDHPPSRSHVLDHRGLVAGMFDARGLGEILAHATHQHPALRDRTVGEAVKALVRKGLGGINHARSRVPRCVDHQPPVPPRVAPRDLSTTHC